MLNRISRGSSSTRFQPGSVLENTIRIRKDSDYHRFIMRHTRTIRRHSAIIAAVLTFVLVGPLNAIDLPGMGALADLIMKSFDTNGDSKIDTGEWQAGAKASFDQIDADGDGKITAGEIDALGAAIAEEAGAAVGALVPKLIKPLILAMDANGDGVVSRDEFLKKMDELFAKLDTNKNAELTREELIQLPLKLLPTGKR